MSDWHVGQEVVVVASWPTIIKDAWGCLRIFRRWPPLVAPKHVYVVVGRISIIRGGVYLSLQDKRGWRYPVDYFRPTIKCKTDISVFTAILDRVNKREVVDA